MNRENYLSFHKMPLVLLNFFLTEHLLAYSKMALPQLQDLSKSVIQQE